MKTSPETCRADWVQINKPKKLHLVGHQLRIIRRNNYFPDKLAGILHVSYLLFFFILIKEFIQNKEIYFPQTINH